MLGKIAISKAFIVPDTPEVRNIRQLLAMNYNLLQQLTEENKVARDIDIEQKDNLEEEDEKSGEMDFEGQDQEDTDQNQDFNENDLEM